MRLHRFIRPIDLTAIQISLVDSSLRHQLSRVFRMNVGDELLLCDGNNQEARVRITTITKKEVVVEVLERYQAPHVLQRKIVLYLSIIKHDHVDLVVEKATELGVMTIVPVVSARTIKKSVRIDRLQSIVREAAEQCGRGTVPSVEPVVSLKEAFEQANACTVRLFCDMGGEPMGSALKEHLDSIALFIGPEGGWTDEERMLAKEKGCRTVSFGSLVLRAETAAIVGVYELASNK